MNKLFVVALLAAGLWADRAEACTCMPMGSEFFESVGRHNRFVREEGWSPLTVVTGKVIGHLSNQQGGTDVVFEVDQVLQGQTTGTITIKGGQGADCRLPAAAL